MKDHANTHTLLDEADAFARSRLSKARYEHTLRVADTAENLALAHGLDADRVRLAALLHDAAREMGSEEFLKLADSWNLQVGDPERQSPKLLHGPVAAGLARRELGIDDGEVLEAVIAHNEARGKATHPASRKTLDRLEADRTAQSRIEQ
jgi:predicted HD superfamily hydrolase involved in NAD metabolism